MGGRRPFLAIEQHPQRAQIIQALIKGNLSQTEISRRYGVNRQSVNRYLHQNLEGRAAAAALAQDRYLGTKLLDEIDQVVSRVRKMYDAADSYLRDCKDPTKYDLGPRAADIMVTYVASLSPKGAPILDKETLQNLILKTEKDCIAISYRIADPRKLLLETANTLTGQLELIARIQGKIKDVVMNVTMSQSLIRMRDAVVKATEDYPEIREKIIHEIERAAED